MTESSQILPRPWTRRPGLLALAFGLTALLALGAYHGGWHLWAWRHDRAARRALAEGDFGRARAHFRLCLEVWTNSGETHRQAARAAWRAGAPDEVVRHLHRCEELGVPRDVVILERALVRASTGDLADVEGLLLPRCEGEDLEAVVVLEALIPGYLQAYRLVEALALTQVLLQHDPRHVQAHVWCGEVCDRLHDYAKAEEGFRLALEVAPGRDDVRLRWAESLVDLGQPDQALAPLEDLCRRQPGNGRALFALAKCQHLLGRLEEARELLDMMLAVDLTDPLPLVERGRLARELGRLAEAEDFLRKALALAPRSQEANYSLFLCLQQQGKQDEAQVFRQRSDQIDAAVQRLAVLTAKAVQTPKDLALRCEMGQLFLQIGQDDEGLGWLSGVLRDAPQHPVASRALADYHTRAGKQRAEARMQRPTRKW
jgi:type IV pilus assembly protein PilF